MGAREAMPSQRTATKRHSSLRLRGRSSGPFHSELNRLASGKLAKKRISWPIYLVGVRRGATQQAALAVDLLTLGAEHDHVRAFERRVLFDLLADFVAVHVRHHDVQEDERWLQAAHTPQAFFAVGRGLNGVALALQQIAERAQDVWLIVDDEDWPLHVALQQVLTRGL